MFKIEHLCSLETLRLANGDSLRNTELRLYLTVGGNLKTQLFNMKYAIISLSILLFSCSEKPKKQKIDFDEKVVDFAIENSNDKFIELPNLYDSLSKEIVPKDEDEKLILVQILKKKGFEVKDWGRGNYPLGPRIISLKLKKENCECEVQKINYSADDLPGEVYKATERIRCKKAVR